MPIDDILITAFLQLCDNYSSAHAAAMWFAKCPRAGLITLCRRGSVISDRT
jgi:hypothetical protein